MSTWTLMHGPHVQYSRKRRKELRERLSESQNHRCAYCSKDIRTDCTIDHIVAEAHGGKLTYFNCVAACTRCNTKRNAGAALKYFAAISQTLGLAA